jgi:hypothetical protein
MRPEISSSGWLVLAGLALVVVAIILGPKNPLTSGVVAGEPVAPTTTISNPTAETVPSATATLVATPPAAAPSPAPPLTPTDPPATYSNVSFAFFAGWTPDDRSRAITALTLWRYLGERSGHSCRIEIVTQASAQRPTETALVWADCVVLNLGQ